MAFMLYQIFNEPMVMLRILQKVALCTLLIEVGYIFMLRNKTMIPFQILNFLLHLLFVNIHLLQ